jgi:hypothetical protein
MRSRSASVGANGKNEPMNAIIACGAPVFASRRFQPVYVPSGA